MVGIICKKGVARRVAGLLVVLGAATLLGGCALLRPSAPPTVPLYRSHADSGVLRAGAAAVDVTPAGDVWMGGYDFLRKSRGVHDPLSVRALVLERGDLRLALVAVDVVGLQRDDLLRMGERIRAAGFDPRHVVVHATHNHSGPDTIGLWGLPPIASGQSAAVMERIEDGIARALRRAREGLRPAEIAAGVVLIDPPGLMKNLRQPGLVDRELGLLHVRAADGGETLATLMVLGVHPEVLPASNREITADFPGVTRREVESELGGVALYFSGALGGMVTPDVKAADPRVEGGDFGEMERVGRRVAALALDGVARLGLYDAAPTLHASHAPFFLRNRNWRYGLGRATGILDRRFYRGGWLETEVNVWALGRLRIVTVPGEMTPDLGLRVKRLVAGEPTLLIGLGNDELGYLLPEAEFDLPIYGYERTLSPGADAGTRVVRRIEDLLLLLRADDASSEDVLLGGRLLGDR